MAGYLMGNSTKRLLFSASSGSSSSSTANSNHIMRSTCHDLVTKRTGTDAARAEGSQRNEQIQAAKRERISV
jgi:hypothetical protein